MYIGIYVSIQLLIKGYYTGDNNIQETFCHTYTTTLTTLTIDLTVQSNSIRCLITNKANDITIKGKILIYQDTDIINQKIFLMSNNDLNLTNIPQDCTIKIINNTYDDEIINIINNDTNELNTSFDEIINEMIIILITLYSNIM